MRLLKNIHSVFISSLLTTILISTAFAGENCVRCDDNNVLGAPTVPAKQIYPFSDYIATYCMMYEQIHRNALNSMIREMVNSPYPVDDYFQEAACQPQQAGERKSPLLHLTAEAPCSRVDYPEIIHKYYTVKRNASDLWLKIVNSTNSKGETFLDYIELLDKHNGYNSTEVKECARKLIAFACKTGAIYLTSNKTCPTGI